MYRVFNKEQKKFRYDVVLSPNGDLFEKKEGLISQKLHLISSKENVLMNALVGCVDKNNKQIYEQDIVKSEVGVGWIEYADELCSYILLCPNNNDGSIPQYYKLTDRDYLGVEVIGNTLENPELLEG